MKEVLMKEFVERRLHNYLEELRMDELSPATINKYKTDINQWIVEMPDMIKKEHILNYKSIMENDYKPSTVNSKLIAINRYLKWLGYNQMTVKTKKIQQQQQLDNVINRSCYCNMLGYALEHNKTKMYYLMKTFAQTGIRVSELKYVTWEAINAGYTIVYNKNKYRTVYFNSRLCSELKDYCEKIGCTSGIIFVGNTPGVAIKPGTVWKNLKYIARQINIPEKIVYPHSFRHMFAKEYMVVIGDISELADLLGHSRLETTWVYTKTTSEEKRKRLELLEL